MDRLRNIRILTQNGKRRHYRFIRYPEIPLNEEDLYLLTQDGDRLDLIAKKFYNDVSLWWIIVSANPGLIKGDGFGLPVGIEIRIPSSPATVMQNLSRLNNF